MKGRKPGTIGGDGSALAHTPHAPTKLSADAIAEWRRVAPILVQRRHLTTADLGALEGLCIAVGMRDEARRTLATEGTTYKADNGLIKAHPANGILKEAQATALRYQTELGLTPVSRARMTLHGGEDETVPEYCN